MYFILAATVCFLLTFTLIRHLAKPHAAPSAPVSFAESEVLIEASCIVNTAYASWLSDGKLGFKPLEHPATPITDCDFDFGPDSY